MIWVFEEHHVLSESAIYKYVWIMGSDICPGLVSWAALRKKTGFFEILSFVVSCRHRSFSYLFSLIPALQHWLLSHQMENMPHRHKIQPGSLTSPQACRKGDQKAPLALQSSSHKAETVAWALPAAPQHCQGCREMAATATGESWNILSRTPQPWQSWTVHLLCKQESQEQLSWSWPKY